MTMTTIKTADKLGARVDHRRTNVGRAGVSTDAGHPGLCDALEATREARKRVASRGLRASWTKMRTSGCDGGAVSGELVKV